MTWAAVAAAGASVAGGLISSKSAKKGGKAASAAQLEAARMQDQLARDLYNSQLGISSPYRESGYTALAALMDMSGLSRGYDPNQGYSGALPNSPISGMVGPERTKRDFLGVSEDWSGLNLKSYPHLSALGGGATLLSAGLIGKKFGKNKRYSKKALARIRARYDANPEEFDTMEEMNAYIGSLKGSKRRNQVLNYFKDNKLGIFAPPINRDVPGQPSTGRPPGQGGTAAPMDPTRIGAGSQILAGKPAFNWQADPGYLFRQSEAMRMLEGSAAARGGLLSGSNMRNILALNQNMASAEYGNIYNRIASIAGLGQVGVGAATAGANIAGALGQSSANMYAGAGMSRGSGYMGQGAAWGNAINQVGKAFGEYYANRGTQYTDMYNDMSNANFGGPR